MARDFSKSKARNSNELINYIVYQLDKTASLYGVKLEQTESRWVNPHLAHTK